MAFSTSVGRMPTQAGRASGSSVIPSLPRDSPERRPALPKHRAQIPHQRLRLLVRRKVPARLVIRLEHDVPDLPSPPECTPARQLETTGDSGGRRTSWAER